MDLRKVKKLIELVEESGIAELEVTSGDESVRIAMPGARALPVAPPATAPAVSLEAGTPPSAETRAGATRGSLRWTRWRSRCASALPTSCGAGGCTPS